MLEVEAGKGVDTPKGGVMGQQLRGTEAGVGAASCSHKVRHLHKQCARDTRPAAAACWPGAVLGSLGPLPHLLPDAQDGSVCLQQPLVALHSRLWLFMCSLERGFLAFLYLAALV